MASVEDQVITKLNEIHQATYGNTVESLIPDGCKLLKMIPFGPGSSNETHEYRQPVLLTDELGFSTGSDAFEYNPPVPSDRKKAIVRAHDISLGSAMSLSDAKLSIIDKKHYKENAGEIVKTMRQSMSKLLEILCLYGQDEEGLAKIESVKIDPQNPKSAQIKFTKRFAPTMWAGSENLKLDAYNGMVRVNGDKQPIEVKSVDTSDRTIVVASKSENLDILEAGHTLHYYRFKEFEMLGMQRILSSNKSTLFGIDGNVHSLWNANLIDANNKPLTMAMILNSTASAVDKGLEEDVVIMTNVRHWNQIQAQLLAQRVFDQSYKKDRTEIGSAHITYYGNNGQITLIPSVYTKIGDGMVFSKKRFKRIGYQDITSGAPGTDDQSVWRRMNAHHGVRTTMWTNQCIFTAFPNKAMFIKNISDEIVDQYSISSRNHELVNDSIASMTSSVASLTQTLASLTEENTQLKATISSLETRITALEGNP